MYCIQGSSPRRPCRRARVASNESLGAGRGLVVHATIAVLALAYSPCILLVSGMTNCVLRTTTTRLTHRLRPTASERVSQRGSAPFLHLRLSPPVTPPPALRPCPSPLIMSNPQKGPGLCCSREWRVFFAHGPEVMSVTERVTWWRITEEMRPNMGCVGRNTTGRIIRLS